MGRTKKPGRTRVVAKAKRRTEGGEPETDSSAGIPPHPPRRNLPLFALSGALLAGFLVYLAIIAWTAAH